MKNILLILILFSSSLGIAQKYGIAYHLGFKINPTPGSGVVTYAIVGVDTLTNKIVKTKFLTEANFVMYCKGIYKSEANPKGINFFDEYGIDCGLMLDDPIMRKGILMQDTLWEELKPLCLPIYDIWKLRYSLHPHYGKGASQVPDEDKGWATTRYRPSYKQTLSLQIYGVNNVMDFFYGPGMFKLFKDMQDDEWVETYKGLLD